MDDFRFSVAMCVYAGDDADNFDAALNSVYEQSLIPDEVVLTVDGPVNEAINSVIDKYESLYGLKVHRLKENMGHGNARRDSLAHCTYDLVAIADADDINRKDRFEKQISMFRANSNLAVVSSGCYHFSESIESVINEEYLPVTDSEIKKMMKSRCPLCQPSSIVRKSVVDKVGGYLDWYYAEDYYLWLRLFLNNAEFANSEECLLYMRSSPDQMNRRGGYAYFKSLRNLYKYMLKNKVINIFQYSFNVTSRFVIQVLMTSKMRAFVRKVLL